LYFASGYKNKKKIVYEPIASVTDQWQALPPHAQRKEAPSWQQSAVSNQQSVLGQIVKQSAVSKIHWSYCHLDFIGHIVI